LDSDFFKELQNFYKNLTRVWQLAGPAGVFLTIMKTKSLRVVFVLFAFTMLTGYVVYSQRQQTRTVAPGSKVMVIDNSRELSLSPRLSTNGLLRNADRMIAPGSKSRAPLIPIQAAAPISVTPLIPLQAAAPASATNTKSFGAERAMVAPGSKSGPVFDLPRAQAQKPQLQPTIETKIRQTNTTVSIKH